MEFLSLKGGRTGASESTRVKMPHCGSNLIFRLPKLPPNNVFDRQMGTLASIPSRGHY